MHVCVCVCVFVNKQGFTGELCEVRECPPGRSGTACDDDVNECLSNPCINGGTCVDGPSQFRCLCAPQFHGVHCEQFAPETSTRSHQCSVECRQKAENGRCDVRAACHHPPVLLARRAARLCSAFVSYLLF